MAGINHKHLNTFLTIYYDYQWRHPVIKEIKRDKTDEHVVHTARKILK